MDLYHQCGFRYNWNIQSLIDDEAGHGLIFSPINTEYQNLKKLDSAIRKRSFLDPQLYLPHDAKSKLPTYDYFPTNLQGDFDTSDFDSLGVQIAEKCIQLQIELDLKYILIPARYYDPCPSGELDQLYKHFIKPFINISRTSGAKKPILLTCIINQAKVLDEAQRHEYLNWVTGIEGINGLYLIFPYSSPSKQIKDPDYISEILYIIDILRTNHLEVHLGYTNTEGLIYSLASPNSIAFGSYENLRRFDVRRFTTVEAKVQQGPNPRLYSSKLLQWVEYGYVKAIQKLYPKWNEVFADSKYKPLIFTPDFNWHFQKPELYKHFFIQFAKQINELPTESEKREKRVLKWIEEAIYTYQDLQKKVLLDDNSDGSHLTHWVNAISLFRKKQEERA